MESNDAKRDIEHFIFNWHEFEIDYWWRKRYNVSFGSKNHKEMNFIDMVIEYQEEQLLIEAQEEAKKRQEEKENRELGLVTDKEVKLTKEQIDYDYETLDLSQFDKK
jgi:hypothetical protein